MALDEEFLAELSGDRIDREILAGKLQHRGLPGDFRKMAPGLGLISL